jgi:hypothetical protein
MESKDYVEDEIVYYNIIVLIQNKDHNKLKTYLEQNNINKDFILKRRIDYLILLSDQRNLVKLYDRMYNFGYNIAHLAFAKNMNLNNSFNTLLNLYKKDLRHY